MEYQVINEFQDEDETGRKEKLQKIAETLLKQYLQEDEEVDSCCNLLPIIR